MMCELYAILFIPNILCATLFFFFERHRLSHLYKIIPHRIVRHYTKVNVLWSQAFIIILYPYQSIGILIRCNKRNNDENWILWCTMVANLLHIHMFDGINISHIKLLFIEDRLCDIRRGFVLSDLSVFQMWLKLIMAFLLNGIITGHYNDRETYMKHSLDHYSRS